MRPVEVDVAGPDEPLWDMLAACSDAFPRADLAPREGDEEAVAFLRRRLAMYEAAWKACLDERPLSPLLLASSASPGASPGAVPGAAFEFQRTPMTKNPLTMTLVSENW